MKVNFKTCVLSNKNLNLKTGKSEKSNEKFIQENPISTLKSTNLIKQHNVCFGLSATTTKEFRNIAGTVAIVAGTVIPKVVSEITKIQGIENDPQNPLKGTTPSILEYKYDIYNGITRGKNGTITRIQREYTRNSRSRDINYYYAYTFENGKLKSAYFRDHEDHYEPLIQADMKFDDNEILIADKGRLQNDKSYEIKLYDTGRYSWDYYLNGEWTDFKYNFPYKNKNAFEPFKPEEMYSAYQRKFQKYDLFGLQITELYEPVYERMVKKTIRNEKEGYTIIKHASPAPDRKSYFNKTEKFYDDGRKEVRFYNSTTGKLEAGYDSDKDGNTIYIANTIDDKFIEYPADKQTSNEMQKDVNSESSYFTDKYADVPTKEFSQENYNKLVEYINKKTEPVISILRDEEGDYYITSKIEGGTRVEKFSRLDNRVHKKINTIIDSDNNCRKLTYNSDDELISYKEIKNDGTEIVYYVKNCKILNIESKSTPKGIGIETEYYRENGQIKHKEYVEDGYSMFEHFEDDHGHKIHNVYENYDLTEAGIKKLSETDLGKKALAYIEHNPSKNYKSIYITKCSDGYKSVEVRKVSFFDENITIYLDSSIKKFDIDLINKKRYYKHHDFKQSEYYDEKGNMIYDLSCKFRVYPNCPKGRNAYSVNLTVNTINKNIVAIKQDEYNWDGSHTIIYQYAEGHAPEDGCLYKKELYDKDEHLISTEKLEKVPDNKKYDFHQCHNNMGVSFSGYLSSGEKFYEDYRTWHIDIKCAEDLQRPSGI